MQVKKTIFSCDNCAGWPIFRLPGTDSDLFIEEPGGGDDEGDVGDHVDHAGPVDRDRGHRVILLQD